MAFERSCITSENRYCYRHGQQTFFNSWVSIRVCGRRFGVQENGLCYRGRCCWFWAVHRADPPNLSASSSQVLSPSHISGITLETSSFGIHCISVDFHIFDTSSNYKVRWWRSLGRSYLHDDFPASAYWTDLKCYFFFAVWELLQC